jgi:hypothetical protein
MNLHFLAYGGCSPEFLSSQCPVTVSKFQSTKSTAGQPQDQITQPELTILLKASPMITPTARSMT